MNASVKLIESVVPTTAALQVQVASDHPSTQILGADRRGTGTLIDAAGLILTVNYILLGAQSVSVSFLAGETLPGRVVGRDFLGGLAVIQVDAPDMPVLPLSSSATANVGDEVFIVGASEDGGRRVSDGCITSLAPFEAYWEYSLDRALLASTPNPGLSGGPMVDRHGQMIGVTALDLNEIGRFSLAIPSETFLAGKDEILARGGRPSQAARAWIGLYCYTFREHVVIGGVLPKSPGQQAGLKAGDVVLAVNGEQIATRGQLYSQLWTRRPGDAIEFRLFRENEVAKIRVIAGNAELFFA